MRKVLLSAAWGDVDTKVFERSAKANAPDWEVVILRPPAGREYTFRDRWRWYAGWLGRERPELVMTVDARDTVIQDDPGEFDWPGVTLFAEPTKVRDEPWNLQDYTRFALKVMAKADAPQNPTVVNGGFVAGEWHSVGLFAMARFGVDLHHAATDQASVTALAAWFPGLVSVYGHGMEGIVYHGHWHRRDGRFDDEGRALRLDGSPYPVFHQWDRTPAAAAVRKAYGG